MAKLVRVKIYGLFPTIYSMCSPCCTRDYMSFCKRGYEEQLREYPDDLKLNQEFLERAVEELSKLGLNVKIEVVNADSLKGIMLSAKHRLGLGHAIIVGGKVFKGLELDFEKVREYVRSLN